MSAGSPDHARYSITGERGPRRGASRREEREEPGSFSPSLTFRLMRPRRAGYFLNLIGRCPRALRDACFVFFFSLPPPFLFQAAYVMQVMRVGESKQHGLNTSARVKQEELCENIFHLHILIQVFFKPALTRNYSSYIYIFFFWS